MNNNSSNHNPANIEMTTGCEEARTTAEAESKPLRDALNDLAWAYHSEQGHPDPVNQCPEPRCQQAHGALVTAREHVLALAATPASSRFLDLDAPETVERLSRALTAIGGTYTALGHVIERKPTAKVLIQALKDRREPGAVE